MPLDEKVMLRNDGGKRTRVGTISDAITKADEMQIHNLLSPAQRVRAIKALEAVSSNLPKCTALPTRHEDEALFGFEDDQSGIDRLRLTLRSHEMRVLIAIKSGGQVQRISFVEDLRGALSAHKLTFDDAVSRLSEWHRYMKDVPTDDALNSMEDERSIVIKAAVGAATRLDDRWKRIGIYPAFGVNPPSLFLPGPSGKMHVFRPPGEQAGTFGTMSDELVHQLSRMSEYIFVASSKPTSGPGVQIDFGPLPSIAIVNDLSSMDLLHAMRYAVDFDLTLKP